MAPEHTQRHDTAASTAFGIGVLGCHPETGHFNCCRISAYA